MSADTEEDALPVNQEHTTKTFTVYGDCMPMAKSSGTLVDGWVELGPVNYKSWEVDLFHTEFVFIKRRRRDKVSKSWYW